jgi:hypothetical protein
LDNKLALDWFNWGQSNIVLGLSVADQMLRKTNCAK